MKQTFLSILAMLFAFAMPVQATEVSGDSRPGYLVGSDSGVVIGSKVTDDMSIKAERSVRHQQETAVILDRPKNDGLIEKYDTDTYSAAAAGKNLPYEVAWRTSTPTTDDTVILIDA